jgi:hypothetical protein
MPERVWLLMAEQGDYEYQNMWVDSVHPTRESAVTHIERGIRARHIGVGLDGIERWQKGRKYSTDYWIDEWRVDGLPKEDR